MSLEKLLLLFLSSLLLIQNSVHAQNEQLERKYKTEHVVVLVIDGPRFTETFGDTSCQYIPRMGKELIHEGVLYSNFRANGPTYTNSGHTAITTGVYQSISNAGKTLPKNPSFFQYYMKEKKVDKSKAWIISSKGKLEILANTKKKKWWNVYQPMTYCGVQGHSAEYVGDIQTFNKVKAVFKADAPTLTLINFLEVDANAHQNDWPNYLRTLQNCDEYAYQLWQFIQADSVMANKTALLITNDHGRHLDGVKDGFVNHGDKCEGCKHISLLAMGPDFKKNVIVPEGGELIDISATIAEILGFCMPSSKGKVLEELFDRK
ncbi:MAG: alkaline phosphatase family protein [Crocinitomicaceae bacterium]|nr:alkaline phosphatase family protein [Crocinitomicaceae bacterium]